MSILKRQVNSSPNFTSLFSFTKDNSSVLFLAQTIYTLFKRIPLKWNFDTFKCSDQNFWNSLCQFWNDKFIPLQIFYPSSVSWKIFPLYFCHSNNRYFAQRSPLKWKFFRLSGPHVKIYQIPYVNFETISRFLSKFCIPLQFHKR